MAPLQASSSLGPGADFIYSHALQERVIISGNNVGTNTIRVVFGQCHESS